MEKGELRMKISRMTKKMIDDIPECSPSDYWEKFINEKFYSLVIISTGKLHDSGFGIMNFVACDKQNNPMFKVAGFTDVLHIDGIGGYGDWSGNMPTSRPIQAWSIDCLPCGYLRLFCRGSMTFGNLPTSDFEIFWHQEDS